MERHSGDALGRSALEAVAQQRDARQAGRCGAAKTEYLMTLCQQVQGNVAELAGEILVDEQEIHERGNRKKGVLI